MPSLIYTHTHHLDYLQVQGKNKGFIFCDDDVYLRTTSSPHCGNTISSPTTQRPETISCVVIGQLAKNMLIPQIVLYVRE